MNLSEPFMTELGIPIIAKIEGGTEEDLMKSISEKFSTIRLSDYPSLQKKLEEGSETQVG